MVQETWDSIKSKYKRETKKIDSAVADKKIYAPNWPHYENLCFLHEASLPKITSSNLDELFQPTAVKQFENSQTTFSPSVQTMNQAAPKPEASSTNSNGRDNEDMAFFHSLLQHVVVVPPEFKLIMRNEINEVVMKYAYKPPDLSPTQDRSPGNYFNSNRFMPEVSAGAVRDYNQVNSRRFNRDSHNRTTLEMIDGGCIKKEKKRKILQLEYDSDDSGKNSRQQ